MADYDAQAEELLPALIQVESGGDPNAVSPKGARGLGQTMPETARDPGFGVEPMRNNSPQEQRRIAKDYLAAMLRKYGGNESLALAAYNAGPGTVDKAGGVPRIRETQDYVKKVSGTADRMHALPEGFEIDEDQESDVGSVDSGQDVDLPEGFVVDADSGQEPVSVSPQQQQPEQTISEIVAEREKQQPQGGAYAEPSASEGSPIAVGDIMTGVRRGLEKQYRGAQQIGSDVSRAISGGAGTPYSPYRQNVESEVQRLKAESENAGIAEKFGENVALPAVEFAAIPMPSATGVKGVLQRVPVNTMIGGGYGAVQPVASPEERGRNVTLGAMLGGAAPEAMAAAGVAGGTLRGVLSPKYGAVREMGRALGERVSNLPTSTGIPKGAKWKDIEGVKPTAGMVTESPEVLILERNARNRDAEGAFYGRDVANTQAVYDALQKGRMTQEQVGKAMDELNISTGNLRQAAFDQARGNIPEMTGALDYEINSIRSKPGDRSDDAAQILANKAEKIIKRKDVAPEDLYQFRKQLDDAMRGKAGNDDVSNAVKSSMRTAQRLKKAIDDGLEFATGDTGAWKKYLQEYASGRKPIEEGKSLGKLLSHFEENKGTYPGGTPKITAHALRSKSNELTFKSMGLDKTVDKLSPEMRSKVQDAINVLNSVENAQKGAVSVAGSPTASYLSSLMQSGLAKGTGHLSTVINAVDALGRSIGARELDRALLDPEKFQRLVDMSNSLSKQQKTALSRTIKRGSSRTGITLQKVLNGDESNKKD